MALGHILRGHAFVEGLSEEQIERLAALATEVRFAENEIILEEGQRSDYFYLVLNGSVVIELRGARFTVRVQALGRDDVFGWSALLDHQDTLFQVRAREATTALRVSGAELADVCHSDGQFGAELLRRLLKVVAGRVKATELKFAEMWGVRAD